MKLKRKRPTNPQIHPRIELKTYKALKQYCKEKKISESKVVTAAVREYLDSTKDMTLILKRLGKFDLSSIIIKDELRLLDTAFGMFLQFWLAHTPEIPESQKEAARMSAWNRYERFCNSVNNSINEGHIFIRDVLPDHISDEQELAEMLAKASNE